MASSRRCVAAAAWLLAAGLLSVFGAAIAFADTESHPGKHADSSSEAKHHPAKSERGPKHDATAATRGAARSADQKATTRGADEQPGRLGDYPDSKPTTQITRSATTQMSAHEMGADTVATNDDVAPSSDPTPPTETAPTLEVASSPTPDNPPSNQTAPPPTPDVATPTDETSAPDTTSSDTTAGSTAAELGQQDASQPPSPPDPTPSTPEVTTASQVEPTSAADVAAPPTEGPAAQEEDGEVAAVQSATDDEGNRRRTAGLDTRGLSPLQILRLLTRTSDSSFGGGATVNPTLIDSAGEMRWGGAASAYGTNAAPAGTSSTPTAVREPNAALPERLQTFLYTYGQLVVAVSLSAMFVAALPGLAGLVIPAAAGVHIGYRQAKAVRAVGTSRIAHLAPPGPIGVVRSASLIALRQPSRRRTPANIEGRAQRDVA